MTGGRVVVIGPTGRNFAAGMSGGIAYVYDDDRRSFHRLCNQDIVDAGEARQRTDEDRGTIRRLLENHVKLHRQRRSPRRSSTTGTRRAASSS